MSDSIKLRPVSYEDPNMITRKLYDEALQAQRVVIIGGEMPEFKFPDIKFPEQKHQEIQIIEVPTIVKEIQLVEVEKVINTVEYKTIEIPVMQEKIVEVIREIPVFHTKIEYVEKPVFVEKQVLQDLPTYLKICLLAQMAVTIILLIIKK